MKSEKKLQQAIRQLDWVTTLSLESQRNCVSEVKRLLHEFMVDNERTPKKGEFNIWDWVANDELRPVMEGVFHDKENKVAVATNAHMLVVDAASYDESKTDSVGFDSGKQKFDRPINKYGEYIDGRFPNYQAVIPPKDGYLQEHVSLEELDEYLKKCRAFVKLEGYGKGKPIPLYKVGNVWLHAEKLRKFIVASDGKVMVKSNDRPIVYWGEKRTALLMPMLVEDEDLLPEALEQGLYMKF